MYILVWVIFQSALLLSSCLLLPPPSNDIISATIIQPSKIEISNQKQQRYFPKQDKNICFAIISNLPFTILFHFSFATFFKTLQDCHLLIFFFSHVFKPFWALRRICQSSDHLRPLLKMKPFWNLNTGINTWRPQEDLHQD